MQRINSPTANTSTIIRSDRMEITLLSEPLRYYRHGWQSWSLAAWTDLDPLPVQKPDIFHTLQGDALYMYETKPNGSWLGAVEFADGAVLLLGALSLDTHVTLDGSQLTGQSEAGKAEWFIARGEEKAVFAEYAHALELRFGKAKKDVAPRVWCSWYSLYTMIDEPILCRVFDQLGDLPFDVLQVDDGWQVNVGDWGPNAKFPTGMEALAQKIRSTGRKAGLWLAPLIAAASSRLFREHSDWFLRDERGRFVSAGFNWGERLYALDTTHPAATEWLIALMKQVRAWGFDYLKLDFLYAGALKGKRHRDMPREAAYRDCLGVLREAMGADAFFLTCGTPILPALGLCDAMRVGPDVAGEWENYRDVRLFYNPSTPGAKNAIRTVVHRLWLKSLVHIDPDVTYFTEKENSLTGEQKALLRDLAQICEFKATSDLPQWLMPAERAELIEFLNAAPIVQQIERYAFRLDDRTVDFNSSVSLPERVSGLTALWASLVGLLASVPLILKIHTRMDNRRLKKRRERLETEK